MSKTQTRTHTFKLIEKVANTSSPPIDYKVCEFVHVPVVDRFEQFFIRYEAIISNSILMQFAQIQLQFLINANKYVNRLWAKFLTWISYAKLKIIIQFFEDLKRLPQPKISVWDLFIYLYARFDHIKTLSFGLQCISVMSGWENMFNVIIFFFTIRTYRLRYARFTISTIFR